jgi:Mrp family chromosome partitioning ATPase
MEQIEKALAKAREMRMNSGVTAFPHANGYAGSTANGICPDYSETTVLVPDPKRLAMERLVAGSPVHPASHVYGLLRTQVLHRMKEQGLSTLVVTGPQLNCGASTTAANLALAIAMDVNQTVLLVDLNLRTPSVHEKFQFDPGFGIDDFLRGEASLSDCLVSPGVSRLVILPARLPSQDSAETLRSPRP